MSNGVLLGIVTVDDAVDAMLPTAWKKRCRAFWIIGGGGIRMTPAQTTRAALYRAVSLALAMLGPGLITASADNDAPGIATYSMAGSTYGYSFSVVIVVITVGEIAGARDGRAHGRGDGQGPRRPDPRALWRQASPFSR